MHTTDTNRTSTLAGLAPTRKLNHTCRGLLLSLALLVVASAGAQTAPRPGAPHRRPSFPMAAPSAKPAANAPANAHFKFITIGADGSSSAVADGINNAGVVTGYYEDASSVTHGFVWQSGVFKPVNYPGAAYTYLFGVSNRGVAIGYYGDGTTNHTVTYTISTGTWAALPDIPNYPENDGYCINDLGVAVGVAFSSTANVAWLWNPATLSYSMMSVPGAVEYTTYPSCLNDKNQVAGYYVASSDNAYHGFIEEGGAYTTVNVPGATETYPDGINNRGTIQGQWDNADYAYQGFLLTDAGLFVNVDYPGSTGTYIVGINDLGDISGGYFVNSAGPFKAFVALAQ